MEDRSRETTPTKDDLDFIVDDGYKHDEDPDYSGAPRAREARAERSTMGKKIW